VHPLFKLLLSLKQPKYNRFFRFLVAGVVNTVFGYSIYCVFILVGLSYPTALLLATMVGVAFNYMTVSNWVFGVGGMTRFFRFIFAYALLYLANLAGLYLLVDRAGLGELLAQLIVLPLYVVTAFLIFRYFVFSGSRQIPGTNRFVG
jgi:putative flippase GtrA